MAERRVRVLKGEDWYDHPKWYDVLHWPGTVAEARGLERVAGRFAGVAGVGRAFEPACGTGRHLRVLARRGWDVVGLDSSEAMVGYGRGLMERGGLAGEVVVGDMAAFGADEVGGGFDVAFCLANSVRHLGVGCAEGDGALVEHLRCVGRVLRPGGVYAVGLGLTVYGVEPVSEDVWEGARGRLRVTQMVQYLPAGGGGEREEGVVSQLAVVTPGEEVHVEHAYRLRSYDAGEWAGVLEEAGMEVVGIVDEDGDDVRGGEGLDWWRVGWLGYAVWVLRPRAGVG